MKQIILLLTGILLLSVSGNHLPRDSKPRVLIFSKTLGFTHNSIPDGIAAIQKLGNEQDFEVDTTINSAKFEEENLKKYAAIIFLNTTGDVLNTRQEAAFERYIQAGGGFVGVHSATDTEYSWGWYGKLVGAYFKSHPATQEAKFWIKDKNFPATSFFTKDTWVRTDELYNFKKMNPEVNILLSIDEGSYKGGENGDHHPMSWYHDFDGGRAFYTALGHTPESYKEEKFLKHLLGGIKYAIGENVELDYSKAKSQFPPDQDRFSKVSLVQAQFNEPTEMTILPNHDVLISERKGRLMWYNSKTKELSQVAKLDVYHKSKVRGVNAEEGFMGLQKDPNYAKNHWIYTYYSPAGKEWVNRLSRFKFKEGILDKESEQIILDVKSDRDICCHTGGSIAFDSKGLLYLSTGDNSTPFDEPKAKYVNKGYAPLNDEPGKSQYDARRSSGNTNDLRGKILRIKVNEDGSYDIPEDNLFPVGTDKTRPEIYTMGHRNPYRISVDQKKGYVYWGDVGPDSRKDDFRKRGPRGYDEMNQARKAGNFGWPYFVADNQPYREYNYKTGESGPAFDPEKPLNNSRNNTGLRELPAAKGAYVFYDYGKSSQFPETASGGRNAMAGPVYYSDLYEGKQKLPAYYDGKVIIYDWIRGWMKAVHLFPNGDFNKMEAFAEEIVINSLIDMEVGPDGRLYLLEYGNGWFRANNDAGLSYLSFNFGNRPPVVEAFEVDKTSGSLPLKAQFAIQARDREKNSMKYLWNLGDGTTKETTVPSLSHTFEKVGEYAVSVEVQDDLGASISSDPIIISAGNTRPEISIEIEEGNTSFVLADVPLVYKVNVSDPDEHNQDMDPSRLYVAVDYLSSYDEASLSLGHQQVSQVAMGEALVNSMDCKACHKAQEASIGPPYQKIALRYKDDTKASAYLKQKIKEGGNGVWGEVPMAPHPDLADKDLNQIVSYIMSLEGEKNKTPSMPPSGSVNPSGIDARKTMVLTASYTDRGAEGAKPLTGVKKFILKSSTLTFSDETPNQDFQSAKFGGRHFLIIPADGGWFALKDIDLTSVKTIRLGAGWQKAPNVSLDFEIRQGSPNGKVIGAGSLPASKMGSQGGQIKLALTESISGKRDLYFVYNPKEDQKMAKGVFVGLMNARFSAR